MNKYTIVFNDNRACQFVEASAFYTDTDSAGSWIVFSNLGGKHVRSFDIFDVKEVKQTVWENDDEI